MCFFFNSLLSATQEWLHKSHVSSTANKKESVEYTGHLNLKIYCNKYVESLYETKNKRQVGKNYHSETSNVTLSKLFFAVHHNLRKT
jgi:hypothetical protein